MKWDFKKNILFKEELEFKKFKRIIDKLLLIDEKIIILFESDSERDNNNVI